MPSHLQAQQWRDYVFGVTNGERAKRLLLAACAGQSFPSICGQWTMTRKGQKKKRPAPTASTAGTCLSVVNIGNATQSKVPWHLYLFPGGYAEA